MHGSSIYSLLSMFDLFVFALLCWIIIISSFHNVKSIKYL